MKVKEIHGWGTDPDLTPFTGEEEVWVEMIPTYLDDGDCDCSAHNMRVATYHTIYQNYGPWGMPPVVCIGDAGWHVAGMHRMEAAFLAGIAFIPAFIIQQD